VFGRQILGSDGTSSLVCVNTTTSECVAFAILHAHTSKKSTCNHGLHPGPAARRARLPQQRHAHLLSCFLRVVHVLQWRSLGPRQRNDIQLNDRHPQHNLHRHQRLDLRQPILHDELASSSACSNVCSRSPVLLTAEPNDSCIVKEASQLLTSAVLRFYFEALNQPLFCFRTLQIFAIFIWAITSSVFFFFF
jgi:hypothetical protein